MCPSYDDFSWPRLALQWRHNECDGVSNHQLHDCLLNRLFGCRSKKASKLCVIGLCEGNSPVTITRKMFPFNDVIMTLLLPAIKLYLKNKTVKPGKPNDSNYPANINSYLRGIYDSDDADFYLNFIEYFLLWSIIQQACHCVWKLGGIGMLSPTISGRFRPVRTTHCDMLPGCFSCLSLVCSFVLCGFISFSYWLYVLGYVKSSDFTNLWRKYFKNLISTDMFYPQNYDLLVMKTQHIKHA